MSKEVMWVGEDAAPRESIHVNITQVKRGPIHIFMTREAMAHAMRQEGWFTYARWVVTDFFHNWRRR